VEELAIMGGRPVRKTLLPYGHQWLDGGDIKAVNRVLKSDFITQGPEVQAFEKSVADYCGARYAVALASGTAALHAACWVAGISSGDEVVTTPLTFAASANAVIYCGGKPVFADIYEDTLNINPDEIRKKLSDRTKALIIVDFAGLPCALDEIKDIARQKGIVVIEDAAHALGAEYRGRKIGALSDMTILSFHPVKHITTGEGGMVLTDKGTYYEKMKIFRHHGMRPKPENGPWYYEIDEPGYNYRLTSFQCALGISQMKKLEAFIKRRRAIAGQYNEAFAAMPEIIRPVEKDYAKAVYHLYVIQIKPRTLKAGRRQVFEALRAENVGVQVHYLPVHLHPYYRNRFGYKAGDYPLAEKYYDHAITLPLFPAMKDRDVADVIKAVKKVVNYYRA